MSSNSLNETDRHLSKRPFNNRRNGKPRNGFRQKHDNRRSAKERGLMPLPGHVEARLSKLRKEMQQSNKPVEEIKQILREERRKAENEFKKQLKKACYRCRDPGHKLSECPQTRDDMDTLTDVCFKCGSAEHQLYQCKSKKTELDYVSCFICSEKGHLSRHCPKNTRGIYPKGGSCKLCSSINHLAKDCPDAEKDGEEPEEEITLGTLTTMESADAEDDSMYRKTSKKPKVVRF